MKANAQVHIRLRGCTARRKAEAPGTAAPRYARLPANRVPPRGWHLVASLFMATTLFAQLHAPNRRERGGPLGLSIQNEVDAAQQRARDWLVATQRPAGDWNATNRCGATAVALIALSGEIPPPTGSVARATAWLIAQTPTELADCTLEARAWRLLALSLVATAPGRLTAEAAALAAELQARPASNLNPLVWSTLRMALTASQPDTPPAPRATDSIPPLANSTSWVERCALALPTEGNHPEPATAYPKRAALLETLATHWSQHGPPRDDRWSDNRQRWLLARFINRVGVGVLTAPPATAAGAVARIDWRNDLASDLVATQRVDPRRAGAGFWPGRPGCPDWAADPVAATAFGLLALGEL